MKQRKISAIIPSNNNSKILSTIKSIREIVDEIIIVNSAQDSFEFSNGVLIPELFIKFFRRNCPEKHVKIRKPKKNKVSEKFIVFRMIYH